MSRPPRAEDATPVARGQQLVPPRNSASPPGRHGEGERRRGFPDGRWEGADDGGLGGGGPKAKSAAAAGRAVVEKVGPEPAADANGAGTEDDYMSEEFLRMLETESAAPSSGGGATYSQRRAKTVREQKERGKTKPLKEREQESLEKGLATKISSDNRGFVMLAKMGFTEGMTIGKSNDGLSEPLPITKKIGKSGIGASSPTTKRKRAELAEEAQQEADPSAFRSRTHARFTLQRVLADVDRCRKACEHLEVMTGVEDGARYWRGPRAESGPEERLLLQTMAETDPDALPEVVRERAKFEALKPEDMLCEVNNYLRDRHHYCVYCGEKYSSAEELRDICPGPSRDDH